MFGEIINDEMQLNELGKIVENHWNELPTKYSNVSLDEYVIMPNHLHGIIAIQSVGATLAVAKKSNCESKRTGARPVPTVPTQSTLGNIVGSFKSLCVHDWLKHLKQNNISGIGKFWQRNYYERIIRNEKELNKIREYISNNPLKWSLDKENPDNLVKKEL